MFRLTHPLPKKYWVAVSGGIDSMAAFHWLYKESRKDNLLGMLHVNHKTGLYSDEAYDFVLSMKEYYGVTCKWHILEEEPPKGESREAWWREKRYNFFHSFSEPVILAHNFDDCLEEYIMCTMVRGYPGTIKYSNKNCIRPFRLWKREDIENYMNWHGYNWVEDPSNVDTKYKRNYIRHELVPRIKELNPGVYNIVEKLMADER